MRKIIHIDLTKQPEKYLQNALLNGASVKEFLVMSDDLLGISNDDSWKNCKELINQYNLSIFIREIKVKGCIVFKVIIKDKSETLFTKTLNHQYLHVVKFISDSVFCHDKSKLNEKLNNNLLIGKQARQQKI